MASIGKGLNCLDFVRRLWLEEKALCSASHL
jgi:hypothetical protein